MHSVSTRRVRLAASVAALAAGALVLAGCAGNGGTGASGKAITVGTTDKITSIDPAGSYDNGSFAVMTQVYPFLLDTPYGSPDPKPSIAESASFINPTTYEVKLKKGLTFENGHKLTASDVKFSFDREIKINDPNGPSSLLGNLGSISTPDALTVDFHLKAANDQTFPQVLTSPAGPIVDEQVFNPDKVTTDDAIVKGKPFAGQYYISSYKVNQLIQYKKFDGYKGINGAAKTDTVNVKYYAKADNLKLDIQSNAIDVAYRSLTATDVANLKKNSKVQVIDGPGGEIRYITFNFNTMPYGAKTPEADAAKATAVRQAAADLIDRNAIATQVYKGTYTPLYSFVPDGLTGATPVLKTAYGDGNGGPSLDKAKQVLQAAGVTTPITLNLQYNGDHYGPSSGDEYGLIKSQLENGGLFKVNLQQTEYVQYSKDRTSDAYPAYQLGWFPDYSDADDYLTPFFAKNNFLVNHYDSPTVQGQLAKEVSDTDPADRTKAIEQVQQTLAKDLPTLPLLQGASVAVVGKDVKGTTLDASYKFRYAPLSK